MTPRSALPVAVYLNQQIFLSDRATLGLGEFAVRIPEGI